jgi:TolB protein
MRLKIGIAFAATLVWALTSMAPAHATFPGTNGKIAFEHYFSSPPGDGGIWTMDAIGTHRVQLTTSPLRQDHSPAWSPDGSRIAFARDRAIWIMKADGSGPEQIVSAPPDHPCPFPPCAAFGHPAWSPDGTMLAFDYYNQIVLPDGQPEDTFDVYLAGADGTGERLLAKNGTAPRWSPDGTKVAFTLFLPGGDATDLAWITPDGSVFRRVTRTIDSILGDWSPDGTLLSGCAETGLCYTIRPDATAETRLPGNVVPMRWSPDGSRFLWSDGRNIFTSLLDGTQKTQITTNAPAGPIDFGPDWQPLPPGPRRSDYRNAAKFCKAERDFLGDSAFTEKYGDGANAYGKCVSAK